MTALTFSITPKAPLHRVSPFIGTNDKDQIVSGRLYV